MRKIDVNKNAPYFSIIVPMYNAARYIKICIDSILNQTFQDFEVIIIDDVSTDDSYNICRELYGDNKKVRLLRHEKNQGQGPARNTGIKNARGKYIGFVDNDDAIIPTALEKIYKATQTDGKEADVVYILEHFTTFQDDDKPINPQLLNANVSSKTQGFLCEDIEQRLIENFTGNRIWFYPWHGYYKKDLLMKNEIEFPSCTGEDHVFLFETMIFAKRYFLFRDSVYIWRVRKNSTWHTLNVEKSINSMVMVAENFERIFNKVPKLKNNRNLKERCLIESFEVFLRDIVRPLYNGINIDPKLDQAVYDTLLPIFGENTTLVKYLFHGFNTMWRQANILAGQNYLLQQRDELIKQQNKILEQMNLLLAQQSEQLKRD